MKRKILLAFEGGGAKGLVHVGALAAIEDPDFDVDIAGAAGTSAGAMVAGLVAAGYTAAELIDPAARHSVLNMINRKRMTDLFGTWGWRRIRMMKRPLLMVAIALAILTAVIALLANIHPDITTVSRHTLALMSVSLLAIALTLLGAVFSLLWLAKQGLADTRVFEKAYDDALRLKVPHAPEGPVTFETLHRKTGCALKVVATCLDTGDVAVFGDQETPDVSIAAAVAASICLPLVFCPATVPGSTPPGALHYDGGLVSNLPAWTFDEERLLDQDTLTIAFEISDPVEAATKRPWSVLRWLSATGRAAIFGGSILNTRGVDRMIAVKLPSNVGVLDFDMKWDRAGQEVKNGTAAARLTVGLLLKTRPDTLNRACELIAESLRMSIVAIAPPSGVPPTLVVRAILAIPYPGSRRLLALPFGAGAANRSDEAMTLPIAGSLAGAAWTNGTDLFDARPFDTRYDLAGPANRRRRSLVWPEVEWRAAIPISVTRDTGSASTVSVLCLDGNGLAQQAAQSLTSQRLNAIRLALSQACKDVEL